MIERAVVAVRVQAVDVAGGGRTWTVLGDEDLPVAPVEEFLEHHRVLGSSPNTVRSYAKGLAAVVGVPGPARASGWEDPGVGTLRAFVTWLRTGLAPAVAPIAAGGCGGRAPAEATVAARLAAVVSFYRFQHDVHGRGAALARASMRSVRRGRYRPMLAHLEGRRDRRASPLRLRTSAPGPPPVLTPAQVAAILEGCACFEPSGASGAGRCATGCCSRRWRRPACAWARRCAFSTPTGMPAGARRRLSRSCPASIRTGSAPRAAGRAGSMCRTRWSALYSDYLWLLSDAADAAGRVLEDGWFVFVNLAREPRFSGDAARERVRARRPSAPPAR